jgi:cell division protein FtsL
MQTILNSKDRNQAFLKFLILFLVTVVLVVFAVYFDYRLPIRENKVFQEEISLQRQQDIDQQKFAAKMQEVIVLIDSMDKPGTNATNLASQFTGKLNDLNILQLKDNTAYGVIDKNITVKLSELYEEKKTIANLTEKANRYDAAEAEVGRLQTENASLSQTIATYQHK